MRIDAGIVEDDVRPGAALEFRQHGAQALEIGGIAGPVGQARYRGSEAILRTGKLRSPCIEKVKTRGSPRKDVGGAVALVHVEIDDQDALGPAARQAAPSRPRATSFSVQKPAPCARRAWWLPPAVLQAMPCSSASRAASSVPAVASCARRDTRSTTANPISRSIAGGTAQAMTWST